METLFLSIEVYLINILRLGTRYIITMDQTSIQRITRECMMDTICYHTGYIGNLVKPIGSKYAKRLRIDIDCLLRTQPEFASLIRGHASDISSANLITSINTVAEEVVSDISDY